MRHDGDEVVLEALELALLGDVAGDDDENLAPLLGGRNAAVGAGQPEGLPATRDNLQLGRVVSGFAGPTLEQHIAAGGIPRAKQPEMPGPDHLLGGVTRHVAEAGVPRGDHAVRVDGQNAVAGALENVGELPSLLVDLAHEIDALSEAHELSTECRRDGKFAGLEAFETDAVVEHEKTDRRSTVDERYDEHALVTHRAQQLGRPGLRLQRKPGRSVDAIDERVRQRMLADAAGVSRARRTNFTPVGRHGARADEHELSSLHLETVRRRDKERRGCLRQVERCRQRMRCALKRLDASTVGSHVRVSTPGEVEPDDVERSDGNQTRHPSIRRHERYSGDE